MWCSDRRLVLLGLPALAGCGFQPVYGEGAAARGLAGAFEVALIDTPFGFALRERLLNRLGGPGPRRYALGLATRVEIEERAIDSDNTISRFQLDGEAQYKVTPLGEDRVLTTGEVRAVTAYSAVGSPFATRAAEDDARRRLGELLADQIVLRLTASAETWAL